jgi:hypothetical protein
MKNLLIVLFLMTCCFVSKAQQAEDKVLSDLEKNPLFMEILLIQSGILPKWDIRKLKAAPYYKKP